MTAPEVVPDAQNCLWQAGSPEHRTAALLPQISGADMESELSLGRVLLSEPILEAMAQLLKRGQKWNMSQASTTYRSPSVEFES